MNRLRIMLPVAVLVALTGFLVAGYVTHNKPVAWNGSAETLDAHIEGWASEGPIPGVLLHIQQGETVHYSNAAGALSKNGQTPLMPMMPFHTASVGKLFTAVTVLRLHERGILNIDEAAAAYLGEGFMEGLVVIDGEDYGKEITIRHLLSHYSGIGDSGEALQFSIDILMTPKRRWTSDELVDNARRVAPIARPGRQQSYSSSGYYILGKIIEAATGAPYHTIVRREVFQPLRMVNTFEATQEWNGREETFHHYVGWFDLSKHDPSFEFADGGFVTNASDLVLFGQAVVSGDLFDNAATNEAFIAPYPGAEPRDKYIGLGPFVSKESNGRIAISHSGYWGVFFIVYPETNTVAVMALGQWRAKLAQFWSEARDLAAASFPQAF